MPNPTNMVKFQNGPIDQRVWYATPQVFVASAANTQDLQDAINIFFAGLELPLTDDTKYSITDVQHAIAGTGMNIDYSALVHYHIWQTV